jgi:putative redox protein
MKVSLKRVGTVAFEASNDEGHTMRIDGPAKLGGAGTGFRPMQTFLVSLAGCSAMDVVMILTQQKQPLEDFEIEVHGQRADAVPAVYEHIHLAFVASGAVQSSKLERAVRLSVEKYCSVAKMLVPEVKVTWEATLRE